MEYIQYKLVELSHMAYGLALTTKTKKVIFDLERRITDFMSGKGKQEEKYIYELERHETEKMYRYWI